MQIICPHASLQVSFALCALRYPMRCGARQALLPAQALKPHMQVHQSSILGSRGQSLTGCKAMQTELVSCRRATSVPQCLSLVQLHQIGYRRALLRLCQWLSCTPVLLACCMIPFSFRLDRQSVVVGGACAKGLAPEAFR